jgi:molybdenum-dependent DNA-binding transcriptional regulator ModE
LAQLGGPNSSSAKNNDMVKEMVKKLKDTSNNLQRLVNDNIDKEKALAALLAINDKLEKALRPFVKADEDSDDEDSNSSDEDTDTADTDDDELFRKNYIERGTCAVNRDQSQSNLTRCRA